MRLLVVAAMVLISACGSATVETPSAGSATSPVPSMITGQCPVTTPPPVALTPPPATETGPNPNLVFRASASTFLYGNDALIVLLPNDGTFHPSDPQRGLAGGVKQGWWRTAQGELVIATRRLDAPELLVQADVPGGYGDSGFQATGINFASPGCWEVTGAVGGKTLTFVVKVAPR